MKKKWYLGRLLAIGLLGGSLALFGCSGDDGSRGPAGAEGPPGPPGTPGTPGTPGEDATASTSASEAHQAARADSAWGASVDEVTVDNGVVTVTFEIERARYDDPPEAVNAEFTIAKQLDDGGWVNLLQRSRGEGTIIRGGNLRLDDPMAKLESHEDVMGEDYAGNEAIAARKFTYTFVSDGGSNLWGYDDGEGNYVGEVAGGDPLGFTNSPLWRRPDAIDSAYYCDDADTACQDYVQGIVDEVNEVAAWDPEGTYRIGVTGRDRDADYARFAAVGDVTLSGGAVSAVNPPAPSNQIAQNSCTTCHGDRLSFPRNTVHGEQRPDANVCFNCHNDYTFDRTASEAAADGWVNISMETIIHKIHGGFDGYTVDAYGYEDVAFPDWTLAGTSNCTACHVGDVPAAGESWNEEVTTDFAAADISTSFCGSCHTEGGYLFDLATHSGGATGAFPVDLQECATCHGQTGDDIHGVSVRLEELRAQREDYFFELISVDNPVHGQTATVTWQLVDGDGNPYTLDADIVENTRLQIGWGLADGEADDWINDPVDKGQPVREASHVFNADDTVTTTMGTLPAEATAGKRGFVALQGNVYFDETHYYPTNVVQTIVLGQGTLGEDDFADFAPRRNTVNASSEVYGRGGGCLDCHGTIKMHGPPYYGWSADNNIQGCVTCHSAGAVSIDPNLDHRDWIVESGKSYDMMYLMHMIHTASEHPGTESALLYPNDMPGRCHACHAGDRGLSVDGPLNDGVSNCNLCHDGALNPGRLGVVSDWNNNYPEGGANSPYASLCYSCHQNWDDHNAARFHMTNLGGDLIGGVSLDGDHYEGCAICHGDLRP